MGKVTALATVDDRVLGGGTRASAEDAGGMLARRPMKIGYVLGAMGRGGAQLQVMHLTAGMVQRGHDVHALAYVRESGLDDELRDTGASFTVDVQRTRWAKLRLVRRWLRQGRFDVVHAVLNHASSLTLFARWPARRPAIIATDFSSATFSAHQPELRFSLSSYVLADSVVTETEVNLHNLVRLVPLLRGKTRVIRNGIDAQRFSPAAAGASNRDLPFRFCVVATVYEVKNPNGVIDAIAELDRRGHTGFRVDWYGRLGIPGSDENGQQALAYAAASRVADRIVFHGDTPDIEGAYRRSDALLLASFREGFPNAVSEGMACGLPIVVSNVSDLPAVVAEANNGYVFDPNDPIAIADAMERMLMTPTAQRDAMGRRSRELALRWFALDRFLDDFESLYRHLADRSARAGSNRAPT